MVFFKILIPVLYSYPKLLKNVQFWTVRLKFYSEIIAENYPPSKLLSLKVELINYILEDFETSTILLFFISINY